MLGYLIDWGNGEYTSGGEFHAGDGHLRNLLGHDRGDAQVGSSGEAKPKNKDISNTNSIGLDAFLYTQANPGDRSGVADASASTHRLAYRGRPEGQGGLISVLMYKDSDGDNFFTPGEERTFTITVNGRAPDYTLAPRSGAASWLVTANGTYDLEFTDSATGRTGKSSVRVEDGNVSVAAVDAGSGPLRVTTSSAARPTGLSLTDGYGRNLGAATLTLLPAGGGRFTATTTLRSGVADLFAVTAPAGATLVARTSLPAGGLEAARHLPPPVRRRRQ